MPADVFTLAAVNGVELAVFIFFFGLVTVLGFVAARWRSARTLEHLDEWGLGGRNFGGWITWFLHRRRPVHGVHLRRRAGAGLRRRRARLLRRAVHDRRLPDRVPGRCRGCGRSRTGTATSPRPTSSAAVSAPRRSRWSIAITGIVATMPYIALQLVGIEAVLKTMGITGDVAADRRLRDPRRLHVPVRPARAGADRVRQGHADLHRRDRGGDLHPDQARRLRRDLRRGGQEVRGVADSPADGTLLADPQRARVLDARASARRSRCSSTRTRVTGVLASRSRDTIKRNMAALPAYSFVLGLLALLGYMAIAAGVTPLTSTASPTATRSCRCCSTGCSPTGSRASRSRRSASARWSPRRSCRSRRRTCSRATSTGSTSSPDATPGAGGAGQQARLAGREGRRAARASWSSTRSSRSTCS